jgi:hypothetical protein
MSDKAIRIRVMKQPDRLMLVDKLTRDSVDLCELITLKDDEARDLGLGIEAARKAKPGTYVVVRDGQVTIDESTT